MLAVDQKARKPAEKIASYATKISEILVMKRQDVNGAEARARELEDEFTRLDIEVSHHTDDSTNDTPSTAVSHLPAATTQAFSKFNHPAHCGYGPIECCDA